jgi:hypothetical protein
MSYFTKKLESKKSKKLEMNYIAFIANIPQHLLWSTFNKTFTFTCKGLWIVVYFRSAKHPDPVLGTYSSSSTPLTVRHHEGC